MSVGERRDGGRSMKKVQMVDTRTKSPCPQCGKKDCAAWKLIKQTKALVKLAGMETEAYN